MPIDRQFWMNIRSAFATGAMSGHGVRFAADLCEDLTHAIADDILAQPDPPATAKPLAKIPPVFG